MYVLDTDVMIELLRNTPVGITAANKYGGVWFKFLKALSTRIP